MKLDKVVKQLDNYAVTMKLVMTLALGSIILFLGAIFLLAFGFDQVIIVIYITLILMVVFVGYLLYLTKKINIIKQVLNVGKGKIVETMMDTELIQPEIPVVDQQQEKDYTVYFDAKGNAYPSMVVDKVDGDIITLKPICDLQKGDEVKILYVVDNGFSVIEIAENTTCLYDTNKIEVEIS
ncbi:MAG: hypothetical protein ACOC1L_00420 [Bacillota bacterium]